MSSTTRRRRKIKFRYSFHAKVRWIERGLSLDEIERTVSNPTQTIEDPKRNNFKSFAKADSLYILVIHTNPNKLEVTIITAYYKDKGGLKKLGFTNI